MREVDHRAEAAALEPALDARAVVERILEGARVPFDVFDGQVVDAWLHQVEIARIVIGGAEIGAEVGFAAGVARRRNRRTCRCCSRCGVAIVGKCGGDDEQTHCGDGCHFFRGT